MSKLTSFEDIQTTNFELVNVNKVVYEEKGQLSKTHPILQIGKNEASLLVAICPSYSFNFTKLSLVDQIPPISGKNLATLQTLAKQNHVILFVGIFELLTPLTFLRGISERETGQTLTFEQAKKEMEAKAQEFEAKFIEREKRSIDYIFSYLPNKEIKSSVLPHFLLTSEVRKTLSFKKIQEEITKFYYNVDVPTEKKNDQLKYFDSVNTCVGTASQRIFKDFHAARKGREFHCIVKDEKSGESYDLPKFMFRLMVEHLLDEMALVMVAGQKHNIDYFVHYISRQGKSKENTEMDRLLNMTKQLFLPEIFANKLFWQPIRFVERSQRVKETKSIVVPSELPVIPEVKLNLSPVPIKRTGSGSSSEGSSSSDDDKSPLPSSPPKTFYIQSDTVTLAKDVYDLLFDLVSSSDSVEVRTDLIETMKKNNLKNMNLPSPKEEITLKMSAYKFLHRLALSKARVEDRINLLDTYRRRESLPDPGTLDLLLTTNNAMEVKKIQTPTATPIPIPLNNNLPVSTNRNGIFKTPQSKAPETQQLQSSPPRRRHPTPPSSPLENGYGFYNSNPQGYRWKRKESGSSSQSRGRTLSASSTD